MTVKASIDPARLLEEQLAQASPHLLRELLQTFINTLLSAEADVVCGAEYGTVSVDRVNKRNGYRRKRAERALTSVVATCYLLGVSTRRMDKLGKSLSPSCRNSLSSCGLPGRHKLRLDRSSYASGFRRTQMRAT